ncbi:MAG: preprotein translocase subunit SecG [Oscillospiraceae bacterium]|nr:preprotein translocase subunit SecG [Oscillospiraceae bacterium]
MNIAMLIVSIVMVVMAVILVAVVLLQSGKTAGIAGAIGGGADTFLAKNKARTLDAKLARSTKWIAVAFLVLSLVLAIMSTRWL